MQHIQKWFVIALCLTESLFGHYHNYDCPSKIWLYQPAHAPFSNNLIYSNVNAQPEPASSPLINPDSFQNHYNRLIDDPPLLFHEHQKSNINYSFEVEFSRPPDIFYATASPKTSKQNQKTPQKCTGFCSDVRVILAPAKQTVPLKKADLQLLHEWWQTLHLHGSMDLNLRIDSKLELKLFLIEC